MHLKQGTWVSVGVTLRISELTSGSVAHTIMFKHPTLHVHMCVRCSCTCNKHAEHGFIFSCWLEETSMICWVRGQQHLHLQSF